MRLSSDVSLRGGDVGRKGVLRGLPRFLMAGSSVDPPENVVLVRPLGASAATAAAQRAVQVELAACNDITCP